MVGGCAALVGVYMVGPRKYMGPLRDENLNILRNSDQTPKYIERFGEDGVVNDPPPDGSSSQVFSALGTLILWMGWYGFNPGNTLHAFNPAGETLLLIPFWQVHSTQ